MWITIVLGAILFISLAMLAGDGLWSNGIRLLNVITAALVATTLWEPTSEWLESNFQELRSRSNFVDFLAIWGVFALTMLLMRLITEDLSKTAVRFKLPVNTVGGLVCAFWTGWVLVCFTLMTLHMAPLARHSLGGAFQPTPEARMFPFAPDHLWLGFVQSLSRGALRTSAPEDQGEDGYNVFDPKSEFILRFAARRAEYQREKEAEAESQAKQKN